jgi:BirA family biotin operon repressor/biotin-[acetyl-CoA-carboxylase] ligase
MKRYYYDAVDSTSSEAKRLIKNGENEDFYVIADSQTEGRGQFGRSFFSPPGTGLYFSTCIKLSHKMSNSFITQAAAVAVCESVEVLHGIKLGIKPINDIIYTDRKVGGILVETISDSSGENCRIIFGIGINLYRPEGGFPPDLYNIAGYIFGKPVDKNALAEKIVSGLGSVTSKAQSGNILGRYLERVVPYERKN